MSISEQKILNNFIGLIDSLSPTMQVGLKNYVTKIEISNNNDLNSDFLESFGSWEGNEEAEEIIDMITNSRKFNRQLEQF